MSAHLDNAAAAPAGPAVKSVYLDNAAAAPADPELLEYFLGCARQFPGNQESMSFHGDAASRAVREAGIRLAAAFGFTAYRTFFANTGTEVIALAAEAVCRLAPRGEVLISALEHPALAQAMRRSCARHGRKLNICPACRTGVDLNALAALISERTAAAAFHHVQSETGGVLDLAAVRAVLERKAPRALLLADTIQSIGKIALDLDKIRPDFALLSGVKLGVPGGAALFCLAHFAPTVHALRSVEHFSGRCPPAVALTLAAGGKLAAIRQKEACAHAVKLKHALLAALHDHGLDFPETLAGATVSPFIAHLLTFPYQGAILTRALYRHKISVAPGSACEAETPGGSPALTAMKFPSRERFCALRVSTWRGNTVAEMRLLAEKLKECVAEY